MILKWAVSIEKAFVIHIQKSCIFIPDIMDPKAYKRNFKGKILHYLTVSLTINPL